MSSILRFRKLCYAGPVRCSSMGHHLFDESPKRDDFNKESYQSESDPPLSKHKPKPKRNTKEWRCVDSCFWLVGCLCTTWWLLVFLFQFVPAAWPGIRVPDSPGVRLKGEGLKPLHPVVLVPGIVTGGLELWEGKPCTEGLFRKRLWGGSFTEIIKRPLCWLEHLSLDNETGLDPPGIRVRAVPGLVAADYFAPGYFVWAVLIENLAKIGYEEKNMHMAAYDWRLSFQNTEVRDQSLSRLKSQIELMYHTNGKKKVVVVPHSMGVIYFLHLLKWVETPPPMGGGGGPHWCSRHIKAVMNIGPAFLGVPKAVSNIISNEGKDVATLRAMANGVLDSEILGLQTLEHLMRVSRTWDSVISLIPKGGETVWGDSDWSPEEGFQCGLEKMTNNNNNSDANRGGLSLNDHPKYGRIIAFGKAAASSSLLPALKVKKREETATNPNSMCPEVWTEYDELSRESIRNVADIRAYTTATVLDLLRILAPKMMQRGEAHFSHGVADDLDDPKYNHYKYWSNPLEMKLPYAPEMEIYCLYGVGIPTERSYIYKMSPSDRCGAIPFRIDSSADGNNEEDTCLRGGVHFVDGDESVPLISAGFMCAKGWKGKTRFNPSGAATYIREYMHKGPASFLEGRGVESGSHVDIMGNIALIEDVLRVAAGATGPEFGGDRIYSDVVRISERIRLRL